jgi:polar amino acid transport system substrate-binding protein
VHPIYPVQAAKGPDPNVFSLNTPLNRIAFSPTVSREETMEDPNVPEENTPQTFAPDEDVPHASPPDQPDQRNLVIIAILALAIVAVCAVSLAVFLSSRSEAPEATLVPTMEVAPTDTGAPVIDNSWQRIETAGRMVAGTSADYPPFEYYTTDFALTGFDIALIREIGQVLGVEVVLKDMAFDGLGGALQLGQIDAAIAAISVTPERDQTVDFSNIYFVTEDAVLSTPAVEAAVSDREDLRGRRIGVQDGTVYQQWAQTELVETGLIDQSQLFVYRDIERAISDLGQGLIDFVLLDLPVARTAVEQGSFVIAAQGLNRQRFALAVPNGARALQTKINEALGALQAAGQIEALAKEYLGLDEVIPVPTPEPEATPVPTGPAPACIDAMQWVADLTYDDQNMTQLPQLAPGQSFVKSWRVRNVGTCTWDDSYALFYAGGNTPASRMGGQPAAVDRLVQPGEEYDFNVNLAAPLIPGVYQAFWTMRNGAGEPFGDRLWVGIDVFAPATATPAPTQTPSPNIQFTVDRTNIRQGECVIFAWNVENVQAVYFYQDGEDWQTNGVAGQGTSTECPQSTTTYNLRVVYPDGTVEVRKTTIFVAPAPVGAPTIALFSVNPEAIIASQCVQIAWDVQGEVTNIRLARDGTVLWEPAPVSGSIQDCPPGSGAVGYNLEATGPGGTGRAQRNINVIQSTAPVPTDTPVPATPAPAPPIINAFAVAPEQITAGQCVQVSWRASGGTTLVQILRNGVIVLDNAPLEGSGQDCVQQAGTVTYRMVASNSAGQSTSQDRSVTVTAGGSGTDRLGRRGW